jgi:hypothetical protein
MDDAVLLLLVEHARFYTNAAAAAGPACGMLTSQRLFQ